MHEALKSCSVSRLNDRRDDSAAIPILRPDDRDLAASGPEHLTLAFVSLFPTDVGLVDFDHAGQKALVRPPNLADSVGRVRS